MSALIRDTSLITELWPQWRGMIEAVVLLIAASALSAALIAGISTWRRVSRENA